jgi:hypothetical protein
VILEDDGSDTPDLEAAAISISVDAITDPPSEPSKEPWYDVKDECFVDEDLPPIPPFEQKALASTPPSTLLKTSLAFHTTPLGLYKTR